jgi:methylmalonyl-CoA mutase
VFAAGTGGADSIAALPFTQALGLPDAFARRLARNTQLVLIEESNLARVADPAAGSGGIEALTGALDAEAWRLFQAIEAEGGIARAIATGSIGSQVAAVRAERMKAVACRKDALTGTSEFPAIDEKPVSVLAPAVAEPAPGSVALPPVRLATPFEELRDASDAALAASGHRPRMFLANLGTLAAFTARATFARNLFEAGGVEALGNEALPAGSGGTDLAALANAFARSGAASACLCSTDEVYDAEAADAVRALKAAGAKRVYLAGRPGAEDAVLRAAGLDGHIHQGIDVVAFLTDAQKA